MIKNDGYSIEYFSKRNTIVIVLPQTLKTLTNTVQMVTNRRTDITEQELAAILVTVKAIFER